jgi:hypothetical protein
MPLWAHSDKKRLQAFAASFLLPAAKFTAKEFEPMGSLFLFPDVTEIKIRPITTGRISYYFFGV